VIVAFDPKGLERCIHCGLCLEACPTYQITNLETESPRGRLHLMGAIADGRIDLASSDATVLHLDRCLACRACEAVCPSGVPYGSLIEETRAGIAWARGIGPFARALLWCASRPRVLGAIAAVLARMGVSVRDTPDQTCCGALHAHAGDAAGATRLAKRNIAAFERSGSDPIVVNAAGCGAHLKSYVHLLETDDRWRDRAAAFAARVRDVNEQLAAVADDADFGELRLRVTYQDPCHLAHAQGIRAEPRALLARVRGLELVEMAGADVCCGSAGFYNLAQPEYADRLLERKVDAILATQPDAVVTANPGCMLQIAAGLKSRGRADIPVLHVVEVLDRARAGS
jgi:glycolate oxidase iron-sulfur subunit